MNVFVNNLQSNLVSERIEKDSTMGKNRWGYWLQISYACLAWLLPDCYPNNTKTLLDFKF